MTSIIAAALATALAGSWVIFRNAPRPEPRRVRRDSRPDRRAG